MDFSVSMPDGSAGIGKSNERSGIRSLHMSLSHCVLYIQRAVHENDEAPNRWKRLLLVN